MRNNCVQTSLFDIYSDVSSSIENKDSSFLDLLDEHLDLDTLIPLNFRTAFYKRTGRKRVYSLESFIRFLIIQKFFGIDKDSVLLSILSCCKELRNFCGFDHLPSPDKITLFKQNFASYLADIFNNLVDITEPICREINSKKADYLIFDTTGIELRAAENNPKFFSSKLQQAKAFSKSNPDYNPYCGVYSLLPDAALKCPSAKQQYINGHFCYAVKAGILTNGLGIPRHIQIFDEDFKNIHPDIAEPKSNNPDMDKEIGDSSALKPVLSDFFALHPDLSYKTFIGDSAFDSYDNFSMLKNEFKFERACIPINPRNSKSDTDDNQRPEPVNFNKNGIPLCPLDNTPFISLGKSKGAHRSTRFKFVCPKSKPGGKSRVCTCETPCTTSSYGRCVYTYPDKDFRTYPGILRGTEHWDNLYRHRVTIERTINLIKDPFGVANRRSLNISTLKADIYATGIVQLLGVILANAIHKPKLFKSIRKLIAA